MMQKNVERTFEITKNNQYIKITIKDNKLIKVLTIKSNKFYLIFDTGYWKYYDIQDKIEIMPKENGLYHVIGNYDSPIKMYCKAWSVEIECENIWREVMKFVKDTKIIC